MNTHRVITSVGIVCFLLSGCSSSQNQKTEAEARAEIEEGFRTLWEETGTKAILEEKHSSTGETLVIIGNYTYYIAEVIQETPDGKPQVMKLKLKEDIK